jgi:hypothetical protein
MRLPGVWRRRQFFYRLSGHWCAECGAAILPSQRHCAACRGVASEGIPIEILSPVSLCDRHELVPVLRKEGPPRR